MTRLLGQPGAAGQPVCLWGTTLDGLVLARSAFEHSVQFRSAMVMGVAEVAQARGPHLQAMVERRFSGRWAQLRPPPQEEKATMALSLGLDEASCKTSAGRSGADAAGPGRARARGRPARGPRPAGSALGRGVRRA